MGLGGVVRSIIRPLTTRRLLPSPPLAGIFSPPPVTPVGGLRSSFIFDPLRRSSWGGFFPVPVVASRFCSSLTETRFPKRRPGFKSRRKRASLKPPGPYAWVQYVPGEPIPRSRPNEGSVQGRNRIKRIKQRKAFILSEKKKRKSQYAEARKKRDMERIERKMAAVAREKAWAQRLIELQQLEQEKKAAMA